MKKTIYLLTRGDEDIGLQVIRAYDTEKDAKQALLALAKLDCEGGLEIKWLTSTSYQVIDPKDPDRCIVDDAGIQECTLCSADDAELKVKKRYLVVRDSYPERLSVLDVYSTNEEAVKRLKILAEEDSSKYRKPYVLWLSPTSYRIFYPPDSSTIQAAAFILPETIPVYENTTSRTVYLLVTDSISEPEVIGVFETKELAIAALKERADQDVKRRNAAEIIWQTPMRYDLKLEEPGYWQLITVEIIERPLQQENEHESSVHTG